MNMSDKPLYDEVATRFTEIEFEHDLAIKVARDVGLFLLGERVMVLRKHHRYQQVEFLRVDPLTGEALRDPC